LVLDESLKLANWSNFVHTDFHSEIEREILDDKFDILKNT